MSSTSFSIISIQFSIYAGLPIFIFGIIGNMINLRLLFSTRTNSCSFVLFISSFFNLIALSVGLLPRALAIGFGIDASLTNLFWCKSRLFISYTSTITSLTCICFASIDRFFASCRSVSWRNLSKLSTVKMAIIIVIPIIIASNVPFLFFYTILEVKSATGNITTRCSSINPGWTLYISYFVRPILLSILPGMILCMSGWLTYRNIISITGIQLRGTFQRSLTSMVFLQNVIVLIPIIPFATFNVYQIITSSIAKTPYRLAQEALILDITNIILYISYASNFYTYIISVSSYRRNFLRLVLFCYSRNHWNNHIEPMPREQLRW
ncbi:unnamed protein product [Rotaria sp. Silwood1]|nr:unnamed protein product [Rotaria sp. Silwood1]